MKVKNICIKGFKGYEEEVIYNLSEYTEIEGGNRLGKTTIGEAIVWNLYGCNLEGNEKADTILMNNNSSEMYVIMDFELDGKEYRLTRKKAKTLALRLNEKKIAQKELVKLIPNKELFLSIFNPVTFLQLSPTQARKTLLSMLPPIDHTKVLEVNDAWDKATIVYKYDSINEGIKTLTTLSKESKDLLNYKQGQEETFKNLLITAMEEPSINLEKLMLSDREKQTLKFLEEELKSIRDFRVPIDTGDITKHEALQYNIETKINIIKSQKYESSNALGIKEMELELASLRGEYKTLQNTLNKINNLGNVCRECGQEIPQVLKDGQVEEIKSQMEILKQTADTYNTSIDILKNMDIEEEKEFGIKKEKEIAEQNTLLEQVKQEIFDIKKKGSEAVQEFEEQRKSNEEKYKSEREKILAKDQQYQNAVIKMEARNKNIKMYEDKQKEVTEEIKTLKKEIKEYDIEKRFLQDYNSMYCNYVGDILSKNLNRVTIELFKINNSTGEIADDFKVKFDGRDISLLSNSERVLLGLELANMFNKSLGIELPTFVDNKECILDIPLIGCQMIMAKVVDLDKITITSIEKRKSNKGTEEVEIELASMFSTDKSIPEQINFLA